MTTHQQPCTAGQQCGRAHVTRRTSVSASSSASSLSTPDCQVNGAGLAPSALYHGQESAPAAPFACAAPARQTNQRRQTPAHARTPARTQRWRRSLFTRREATYLVPSTSVQAMFARLAPAMLFARPKSRTGFARQTLAWCRRVYLQRGAHVPPAGWDEMRTLSVDRACNRLVRRMTRAFQSKRLCRCLPAPASAPAALPACKFQPAAAP